MKYLLLTALLALPTIVHAQNPEDDWMWGANLAGTFSRINHLNTTVIRPWYQDSLFGAKGKYQYGLSGGMLMFHRWKDSRFAIQPEITYAHLTAFHQNDTISKHGRSHLRYEDSLGLKYDIRMNYEYLNLSLLCKIYPLGNADVGIGGLFITVGPKLGLHLARQNITYRSNMPELGPDLQIQENLRGVLKARTDFVICMGLGYEFYFTGWGLTVDARYGHGIPDVVETLANGYNFIDNKNNSQAFQLTASFVLPLFK